MEAEELAQRRILEEHARAGVTFLHPGTTRVEAGVRSASDTVDRPGREPARRDERRRRLRRSARTRPSRDSGSATARRRPLLPGRGRGRAPSANDRPVRLPAARAPSSARARRSAPSWRSRTRTSARARRCPHLSYIGDADVGDGANLGASTITANYDGRRKHRTKLGKSVKTGIHTSFVAPVDVGDRAYTGAGSVITEDVPDGRPRRSRGRSRGTSRVTRTAWRRTRK